MTTASTTTRTAIETWLIGRITAYGKVDATAFTAETALLELGLDSVYVLTLCGDIEDEYGLDIDPTELGEHETVGDLATWLSTQLTERPSS
jgi:acyl carrier protein